MYTPEDYLNGKYNDEITWVNILQKVKYSSKDKIEDIINAFINSGEADKYFKDLEMENKRYCNKSYRYKLENEIYLRHLESSIYDELSLKLLKIRSKYLPVKWNEADLLGLIPDDEDLVKAINSKDFLDIWNKKSYDYSLSEKDIDDMSSLLPDGYFIMFDDFMDHDYAICYRYGNRSGEWIMLDDIWMYIDRYNKEED